MGKSDNTGRSFHCVYKSHTSQPSTAFRAQEWPYLWREVN